jgi:uncharacterized metal-binding protein YceD (DUF177 family)
LKIELRKIPFEAREFETDLNGIILKGIFYKENQNLAKIEANLVGEVEVECNKCTEPFLREVDEKLKLIITDKIFNGFDDEYDVIEITSQSIDFDDIITSEIESIKLDFDNICNNCEDEIDLEFN